MLFPPFVCEPWTILHPRLTNFFIWDNLLMADNNILSELAAFADSGEHTKFQLLQNWQEYKHYRKVRYSIAVVLKFLSTMRQTQFKSYCEEIISGKQDIYKLLDYKYIDKILDCYKEELKVVHAKSL